MTAAEQERAAPIQGRCWLRQFHGGLTLHVTDGVEADDFAIVDETDRRLCALLFLEGGADIALGRRPLHFGEASGRAEAALMAVAGPDRFVRYGHRGARVTKVCLSLDLDWLEAAGLLETGSDARAVARFSTAHGKVERWRATEAQRALALSLLSPGADTPLFETLRLESQALAFASQMLRPLASEGGEEGLTARDRTSLRRACIYLEGLEDDDIRLADVARAAGVSVSGLQRLFRTAFGTTAVAYLRGQRLQRAHDLLIRDQISVTEAAFQAGYSDPANFAKAFRRKFGHPPSALR